MQSNVDGRLQEGTFTEEASVAYLDQFAQLDGSVPDLAATLTTQAEQDAEDANVSFLRGDLPDEDEEQTLERYEESRRRRRRAVDAMLRGPRYTPEQLREMDESEDRAMAGPSNGQYYNGWAPGASDDDEDYATFEAQQRLPGSANPRVVRREDSQNLRERMRNRLRRDHLEAQLDERSNSRRNLQMDHAEPETEQRARSEANPPTESSLRTTALLQAVRRNSQFSAHSRNQLQRYILDRERSGSEVDDRATAASARPFHQIPQSTLSPSQRRQIHREADAAPETERQRLHSEYQHQLALLDAQALHTALQRGESYRGHEPARSERRTTRYWTQRTEVAPKINVRSIDKTIQYLERLRLCESDQEGLITAEEGGFESEERQRSDFLIDTRTIPSPPQSSWLDIGGVLSGTQNAVTPARDASQLPSSTALPSYVPLMPPSQYRSRVRHPTFGTTTARTTSPIRRESIRPTVNIPPATELEAPSHTPRDSTSWVDSPNDERWPVKVTIHSIDYDTMTLSGTMEAFNVPDKSSPTRESSITTFLEGEIVDFNKHTLETKSFKADARIDAVYWRKLPPFCHMKDDNAMSQSLLSKEWLKEELMEKWILMRWKGAWTPSPFPIPQNSFLFRKLKDLNWTEKCFVTPSDAQSSLTISGFYYVSLRRSNGLVEGLYYDPSSTPYQHLVLKPERKTFPSYTFQ